MCLRMSCSCFCTSYSSLLYSSDVDNSSFTLSRTDSTIRSKPPTICSGCVYFLSFYDSSLQSLPSCTALSWSFNSELFKLSADIYIKTWNSFTDTVDNTLRITSWRLPRASRWYPTLCKTLPVVPPIRLASEVEGHCLLRLYVRTLRCWSGLDSWVTASSLLMSIFYRIRPSWGSLGAQCCCRLTALNAHAGQSGRCSGFIRGGGFPLGSCRRRGRSSRYRSAWLAARWARNLGLYKRPLHVSRTYPAQKWIYSDAQSTIGFWPQLRSTCSQVFLSFTSAPYFLFSVVQLTFLFVLTFLSIIWFQTDQKSSDLPISSSAFHMLP